MKTSCGTSPSRYDQGTLKPRLLWLCLFMLLAMRCAAQTCGYTVTTLADSGAGSLRAGLADSTVTNICFGVSGTITLDSTLQIYYPVTITGTVTIDGNNQVQIFQVNLSSGSDAVRINGLTLTHGSATSGGALEVVQGDVTLVGTAITGNAATWGGGVNNQSTLTLSQCGISNNTASGNYYTYYTANYTANAGAGGGIYNSANAVLTVQGTTVSHNSSVNYAGGLYNAGIAQVTGGVFNANSGFEGGAIYNDSYGSLSITGGTSFSNNTAAGGGAIFNLGMTRATQSLFTGNAAQASGEFIAEGGALYNSGAARLTESTLNSNSSTQQGGAIENLGNGVLTLVNDTLYGNSASTGSGVNNQSYGTLTIHNTIIAGTAPTCTGCTGVTGKNLIDVEPYLGPLAANGGSTYTMMPLPGGPAVGGGDPNAVVDDTDQRGFSRFSSSGSVDIGAVQSHYSAITYQTQPSNTFINQTITSPVAVQVLEVDGETKNYPLGVPVNVSLFTSEGIQASSSLSGTLTQLPVANNGVTAATFPDLAVNTAGSYELLATIVPPAIASSASEDPAYGVMSNIFQIYSAPVITWQPAPIPYGPMPAAELNATATVDGSPAKGTFVYTFAGTSTPIAVGQIYPVGAYKVQVTFTPAGFTNQYSLITSLQINPAMPLLKWPTPAPIYTSTPLSSTQLDATATGVTGAALPGTFVYNPAAGATLTAGSHVLSTTFTPTDNTNYTTATAQVNIQVNVVTAASVAIKKSADPITFGQNETFAAVVTGTDGNPFSGGTAAFTVDGAAIGSVAVVNGSAAVSTASLSGGTRQVGVTYTMGDQTLTASTTLTVNRATPVLTWPAPAPIYTSTPLSSTQLNATATGVTGAALPGTFVYNPAAGAKLPAGAQTLSTTFTPTDSTDYTTNTAQVTIQVNLPAAASVTIKVSANPITYGQTETLTAVITGTDGLPYSGGTASFTSDGTAIGTATVVNGSSSVRTASLTAGTHQIAASYTNSSLPEPLTASTSLVVSKAAPVIAWPTPAPIYTVTPLSSTQLDATATGVTGASLPGMFVYSPAAGTLLPAGSQTLGTTFTPTDNTNYTTATAQVTIQVGYSPISIASVSPGTAPLGTTPLTITLTGNGFTSTSVVEVNGAAIPTQVQSSISLTATIPAANLANPGSLKLLVYDPQSKISSNTVQLTVTAPPADVTFSVPPTTSSGEQPTVTIGLNSPYPTDLLGTLTLTFASGVKDGADDPAIQLSTGGRTLSFTVPAGSTKMPQIALQTGTVAGTITLTLTLTTRGVDVTPAGLSPITLVIAAVEPVITSVTFTNNSDGQITVVISGFSNTRDMNQAEFVFTGSDASHLRSSKVDVSVTGLFTPWYNSTASDQYGSEFTYTQNFQLSRPDAGLTGVSVTLANSVGTSGSVNSQ